MIEIVILNFKNSLFSSPWVYLQILIWKRLSQIYPCLTDPRKVKILCADGYRLPNFAWGRIPRQNFVLGQRKKSESCVGTDLNTAIFLGDGYRHQIQRIGVRKHSVSYPISRISHFLLFGERNVSGFMRINTMLLEGCENRLKYVGTA